MPLNIYTLEHEPVEGPGAIADWAAARGHALRRIRVYAAHDAPWPDAMDLLVILGGPMNIYQHRDHPWLVPEKAFISRAIAAGVPILGICLGAQLLADALGGKVFQNPEKEIGWFPVKIIDRADLLAEFPDSLTVMQWHGDTFTLPEGARRIAESDACIEQGFIYRENVVALQFHLEMNPTGVADLSAECAAEFVPARFVQSLAQVLDTPADLPRTHAALFSLLDRLCLGR